MIRLCLSQITTDRWGGAAVAASTPGGSGNAGAALTSNLGAIDDLKDSLAASSAVVVVPSCISSLSCSSPFSSADPDPLSGLYSWAVLRVAHWWRADEETEVVVAVVGEQDACTELPLHSLYGAILFKSPIELALFLSSGSAIKLLLNPHELLLESHSVPSFTVASGDSEVLAAFVISRTIFGVCAPTTADCCLGGACTPFVPTKDDLLPK